MPPARSDLLIVIVLALASWPLSSGLDISERIAAWAGPLEVYQADELPVMLAVTLLGLVWYSWRRSREARTELVSRAQVERQLTESLAANRRLSVSHVAVQEAERREIARELHDELGQYLNAMKIEAVALREHDRADTQQRDGAQAIVRSVAHLEAVLRDMLGRLRPVALDELGLSAALEHLADHWRSRQSGPALEIDVESGLDELGEACNIAIYRIVQESLTNVLRHAGAERIQVALGREGKGIRLTIDDDGAGLVRPIRGSGLGVIGMRERVEALGGRFEWTAAPGRGCRVSAYLPEGREGVA
jgi:signal transduction histidine kinase